MAHRTMARSLQLKAWTHIRHPLTLIEHLLLATFLLCRAWLFYVTAGIPAGFDAGAHMEMLKKLTWMHPDIPVRDSFYSYHPPMGFLMARTFHLLGLTPEVSIQIVSAAFALLTFFFLRQTLSYLKILYTPASIVFLYVGAAIPLQIYLASSINLESIILSTTAGVLYCSVRMFWEKKALTQTMRTHPASFLTYATLTVALLVFGMMTKFSGLLLFAIPPFVAALTSVDRHWMHRMIVACIVCIIALGIAFPYYYVRYEKTEGSFFPYNGDWIIEGAMQESRAKRDANPVRFFVDAFEVSPVHTEQGIRFHDYDVIRLLDVWRDFWLKDQFLGTTPRTAEIAGIGYVWSFPMLVLIALPTYLLGLQKKSSWNKFGALILGFATLQFFAMVLYVYKNPFPGWGPNKGMYIASAMWGIAFLIGTLFGEGPVPLWRRIILVLLLLAFVIVNHVIPIYA